MILGIDPGTIVMGYGIIVVNDSAVKLLEMNAVKLSSQKNHYERLNLIQKQVTLLIEKYRPDYFAIEAPFFGKNVQSMLKLGRAQGVAIAVAMQAGIPVTEYSPRKIKQSITGNGNAGKEQVWKMLQHIIVVKEALRSYDASDALAVAVCHQIQLGSPIPRTVSGKKNKNSWSAFIDDNPSRIITK